jgi:hypothetical protein
MFVHLLTLLKIGAVCAKATFYYEFHRLPLEQVICSRHYMDSQDSAVGEGNALELYHIYIPENMYDISIMNRLKLLNVKRAKHANPRKICFHTTPNVVSGASLLE